MNEQVMIYEVKSTASSNAKELFSKDSKFFYWNQDKFVNLNINDYVFVINNHANWVLFTRLNKIGIPTSKRENSTFFVDLGVEFNVSGKWNQFVRLEIIEFIETPIDWSWKSLGNSETSYLNGKRVNLQIAENRIKNINQLHKITQSELFINVLNNCLKNFKNSGLETTNVINESEINKGYSNKKTIKEIINESHLLIQQHGFKYDFEEIANFYLALRTKPFVILAGISGTGKTQLPRKFAEALGFSENQVRQIPVKPDWTDSSELIGYVSLSNVFVAKELTLAIQEAIKPENINKPYFFILDEMNLARVEHYFSDFLSVIETRKRDGSMIKTDPILRKELLNEAKNKDDFGELGWPQNMFLIGTVNMDETTHTFSRKVLDRANSIEMNEVDLNWIQISDKKVEALKNIDYSLFETPFIISKELSEQEKESISDKMSILIDVNKILQKADIHFAYRVRDEIAFYLIQNKKYDLMNSDLAFDFQLVQKVLPRIHGSSERIQKVLIELIYLLEKGKKEEIRTDLDFERIEKQFPIETLKFKRASKKILFMLKRFDEDRFTSFWL